MILIKLNQPKHEEGEKNTCGCYDADETRTEGSYLPTTPFNIKGIPNHCSSHMHASPTKYAFKHLNFSSNKHVSFPLYPQLKVQEVKSHQTHLTYVTFKFHCKCTQMLTHSPMYPLVLQPNNLNTNMHTPAPPKNPRFPQIEN